MLVGWLQDWRYALVMLRRQPRAAGAVIVLTALGLGITTTVYAVANALLVRQPSGIIRPDALVRVDQLERSGSHGELSYFAYVYIRDHNQVLDGLGAYDRDGAPVMLRGGGDIEAGRAGFVSGNLFEILGTRVATGRLISPSDDQHGAAPVAVVSQTLRDRLFAGRDALGATLHVNGQPFTVVGVAAPEFSVIALDDPPADVWLPIWSRHAVLGRSASDLVRTPGALHTFAIGVGRLRPGVTEAAAQANLATLAGQFDELFPEDRTFNFGLVAPATLGPHTRARLATMLRVFAALAAIVLLIVCANVAGLLLARMATRGREINIRFSVGASRWRLVRQLLTEGLLLAALSGAVALLIAAWSADLLNALLLPSSVADVALDWRVIVFVMALSLLCAFGISLYPALRATHDAHVMRSGGLLQTTSHRPVRFALVVAQLALATMLLVATGLLVRTAQRVHELPLGFKTDRLVVPLDLRPYDYTKDRAIALYSQFRDRVAALPGVHAAVLATNAPLDGSQSGSDFELDGVTSAGSRIALAEVGIEPGYVGLLGFRLTRGRNMSADAAASEFEVLVNDALARRYWPGEDALGKRLRANAQAPWLTVVGVVNDSRTYGVLQEPEPILYKSALSDVTPTMRLMVHAGTPDDQLIPAIRRELAALDPNLAPPAIRTVDHYYRGALQRYRTNATLISLLGVLALLFAIVGLYATLSVVVAGRTREIGIRMAVGAQSRDVLRLVLGDVARLAALGLGVGTLLALGGVRLVSALLYGVSPLDTVSFAAAIALLGGTALCAGWLPARRASRVDPMVAVRYE